MVWTGEVAASAGIFAGAMCFLVSLVVMFSWFRRHWGWVLGVDSLLASWLCPVASVCAPNCGWGLSRLSIFLVLGIHGFPLGFCFGITWGDIAILTRPRLGSA